jgi:hypothetical protein
MLVCGTVRSAGHSGVPKHAWAASDSGHTGEMLAALDPLAVEVVAAGARLEREAQSLDEQLAALRRIWRDHRDAGNELNVHARSLRPK